MPQNPQEYFVFFVGSYSHVKATGFTGGYLLFPKISPQQDKNALLVINRQ